MKKIISVFMILTLAVSLFGCGKTTPTQNTTSPEGDTVSQADPTAAAPASDSAQADLTEAKVAKWAYVKIDEENVEVDSFDINAVDGSWRITVHLCDESDLEKYKGYFTKALDVHADDSLKTGKKTFGAYEFDYEYHDTKGDWGGAYFCEMEMPVTLPDDLGIINGVYCYLYMEEDTCIPAMEEVMNTFEIRTA